MPVVTAEYDGRAFIPCMPVDLPVGTRVGIYVPDSTNQHSGAEMTPEREGEWQQVLKEIQTSEPFFQTVDEALRHTRGRP